jgi:hypothetical protein
MSLRDAVDKARLLYQAIGRNSTTREVIARSMGYAGLTGTSATTISALNKFGLIDGRGDEVRVSDRAMAILNPLSDAERATALREAAMEPALFRELSERFTGAHLNEELLKNYLLRNGFALSAVSGAISAFKETMEFVRGLGSWHDSASEDDDEERPMQTANLPSPPAIAAPPPKGERKLGGYDFENGGYVKIVATDGVDTEEALEMVETLIKLKRAEIAKLRRQDQGQND